jgi:hypothetical protein
VLIGEIVKNVNERLRITVESYRGHSFVDLRIYYRDHDENWKPTTKGVALKPNIVDEVIRLLTAAQAAQGPEQGEL